MTRHAVPSSLCLALLLGGCPKRQTSPTVVYVPAAPAPSSTSAPTQTSGGEIVLQESQPPETQEKPAEQDAPEPAAPKNTATRRRAAAPTTTEIVGPADEPAPAPANTAVPVLEPRESPQQQSELRNRVQELNQSVQARIARLEQTRGSNLDANALEGARGFLAQSRRALEDGDLQRAYNLARKSALLVEGMEQKH